MADRRYYSTRTGKNPGAIGFDLDILKKLFLSTYQRLGKECYFQAAFGYDCVDAHEGIVPGFLGWDSELEMQRRLRKPLKLHPLAENILGYSEDDLFDVIEFLYDCVATPLNLHYHSYGDCGWHSSEYDFGAGRLKYREEVNSYLQDYQTGYQLSENGEILALADPGLQPLLDATLPGLDPANIDQRVQAAVHKFRRHRSSLEDRRDAIRDLADVLEYLRPKASEYLLTKKDDGDLHQIANNFAIRHHNPEQKSNYNKGIWYSWMFYFYLATIHAAVRVIKEAEGGTL